MTAPTFTQNTIANVEWNEPRFPLGSLVLDVSDQLDTENFENGWIRIMAPGFPDIVTRVITFRHSILDDEVEVNVSVLDWGARPANGTCTLSDDDLSDQANFTGGMVGSDIGVGLLPGRYLPLPNTNDLTTPYEFAYILPTVEMQYTTTTGIPFIKNMAPGDKTQWDPARLVRGLPVPTSNFWTVYVFSAFQAEADEDADSETVNTKGVSTHKESLLGNTPPFSSFGSTYTSMAAIFSEVLDDAYGVVAEQRTVAHEIAHCLGVDHGTGLMGKFQQGASFSPESLDELRKYAGP